MRVARYYCPTARETFSLLPDCLSSRFPSGLDDLERVVIAVEAAQSVEAAADTLRPDIVLPSAVRWVRRRLRLVHAALVLLATTLPDLIGHGRLTAVRTTRATDRALVAVRHRAAAHLSAWPRPLGFGPHRTGRDERGGGGPTRRGARHGPAVRLTFSVAMIITAARQQQRVPADTPSAPATVHRLLAQQA